MKSKTKSDFMETSEIQFTGVRQSQLDSSLRLAPRVMGPCACFVTPGPHGSYGNPRRGLWNFERRTITTSKQLGTS